MQLLSLFEENVCEERSRCVQAYDMYVTFETVQLFTSPLKELAPLNIYLGGREGGYDDHCEAHINTRTSRHSAYA